ncbi:hypothetical protein [uncultured Streptomyces sp.]|uniref:hypothetical protein n=1 Tax=uncultured Streptomyces sp. TaxID=174707 RepID=UPI003429EE26
MRGHSTLRLRRALRRQRRAVAAGLALSAATLAAPGFAADAGRPDTPTARESPGPRPVHLVSAPVRIADAATVRLLRPGDRVDVIDGGHRDGPARVLARDVRVARVPRPLLPGQGFPAAGVPGEGPGEGALVVLSVDRSAAAALVGAGTSGRLAVAVTDAH